MANKTLDARGLQCPMPVIKTKKAFEETQGDLTMDVLVDNDIAVQNVTKFAKSQNFECESQAIGSDFKITIKRGTGYMAAGENVKPKVKKDGGLCILIGTDKIGRGNDELGAILMKSYIFSLTESRPLPEKLIFLNSGVNLTTTNKEAIENLKKLEQSGTTIISCGTCLDFYNLKDKVAVGSIGNMYDIVDSMNLSADKYAVM